ncbi:restriction endonuclease subunit S [Prevotella sp. HMSC073D09]|uniref:restriction endonuclease subunit S n=1 Tax=Prevotella sp. HMSC073D09 TaxID=1739459 RepID=UPI0008A30639|nr:restriction endonuclease subunit S [Prevotella sp. HMSC073D09]OFQ08419.1 restriction endonuclease subunit S [Prevotella sp. HMSC073D09]
MVENKDKKVLNVPNLRFPEFEGEWEKCKLSDLCTFFSGGTPNSSNKDFYGGKIAFIRSGELHANKTELFITQKGFESSSAKMVDVGDLLLAMYGATSGDIAISKIKGAINQAILCIRTKQNKKFIESVWNKHVSKILMKYLQGGQGNLSTDIVKSLSFSFPTLAEQERIAKLMALLDERISTQNKIIDKLQSLIKGIMVELQKQGQNKGNWRNVLLSKVLTERDERNTNFYQVFSVSVSRGVINQVDYLGRSFAARDISKYNVVHYGDLVYTKSPTGAYPYGIVKQNLNQENVAVSPLYGVYIPNSLSVGTYLHEYFMSEINTHNYLHPLIQKGAKNTINITNQRFLENSVPMPVCANELLLISKLLLSFNDKIKYQKSILQQYQKQKQYLLRQMFI